MRPPQRSHWRASNANVIASDRTLREIALLRPRNLEELELAHGIGPARRDRYSAGLLAVVKGGIEPPARAEYRGLGAGGG